MAEVSDTLGKDEPTVRLQPGAFHYTRVEPTPVPPFYIVLVVLAGALAAVAWICTVIFGITAIWTVGDDSARWAATAAVTFIIAVAASFATVALTSTLEL